MNNRFPILMALLLTSAVWAESATTGQFVPPLRLYVPFEAAWRGMHRVLRFKEIDLVEEERARGTLVTSYIEYSSGTLTRKHMDKIGARPKLTDGDWVKVEYRYEISIDLIEAQETLVTVTSNIRALKRNFLGEESWHKIPSNGQREQYLLQAFGEELFGQKFQLDKTGKGLWTWERQYVPDMSTRTPTTNRDQP